MSLVAVLGASGVYGRHLLPRLVADGHGLRALVRTPAKAAVAAACGAEVRAADIFDHASLVAGLEGCDVAINLATALPAPGRPGDYAHNDVLRREGTPIWVRACLEARVPRVVQQSVALVHSGGGDAWADESTPYVPSEDGSPESAVARQAIEALLAMEATVRESELDWLIVRGGFFYGPGTGYDDDWFERARSGRLRLPGEGEAFLSLVHIADMAAATVCALRAWPSRQALIVADDRPARGRDVFGYVSALAGAAPPAPGGRPFLPSCRVANRRAKEALGWAPLYPDYRSGLVR